MVTKFKLSLYVTPDCSGKALAHLYDALSVLDYNDYELAIIDARQEPEKANQANVTGTPALVSHAPGGDLLIPSVSNVQALRKALGIAHA